MKVLKFKQVDVFTRVPFSGNPGIVNVGPRWLVAELDSAEAVGALAPDMQGLAELSNRLSIGGSAVTCIEGSLRLV